MKKSILALLVIMCIIFTGCSVTTTNTKPEKETKNINVENTKYTASDNSYLVLGKSGEKDGWKWYQSESNLEDNYYAGKYQFFSGNAAKTFITKEITCYGITEEELERVTGGNYDNLVVFFVEYSEIKVEGESKMEQFNNSIDKVHPKSVSYYGQTDEDGNLNLVNMMSANQVTFTKIEDSENTDDDYELSDDDEFYEMFESADTSYHSETEALNNISFDIPEKFCLLNVTDVYVLYNNYRTKESFCIYYFEGSNLEKAKRDHKNGVDIEVNGRPAYKFENDGEYYFSVEGNGGEYMVNATSEKLLNHLIKTFEIK